MSDLAIRVENPSKLYPAHPLRAGHIGAPFGRQQRHDTPSAALRTGLRDVSFEACPEPSRRVTRGEVVGIIGRNGAGKSTLLKPLSRIAEPASSRTICAKVRFAVS